MRLWFALVALAPSLASAHPAEDEAIARLDARLADDPSQVQLHAERAARLLRLMQPKPALAALERAGRPTASTEVLRGRALAQLGDLAGARAAYDRALDLDSAHVQARWRRAQLAQRTKDARTAIRDLQQLRARPDAPPEIFLRLGRLLPKATATRVLQEGLRRTGAATLRQALVERALQDRDFTLARDEAKRLVDAAPASVDGKLLLAKAERGLGQAAKAKRLLKQALEQAERHVARRGSAASYVARARARLALGDRDGARADLDVALGRAPTYPPALDLQEVLR